MKYDIFEYVAVNNPIGAKAIINKYGFAYQGVQNEIDLGDVLRAMVAEVGMSAFKDVLAIHPDREVIVEDSAPSSVPEIPQSGCNCGGGCSKKQNGKSVAEGYLSDIQQSTGISMQQGNLFLIGAALILAVAIVSK